MPPLEDSYRTIEEHLRAPELKVKGSRFIADIVPAHSKEDVESALAAVRKEFFDASHHCFAYRLTPDGSMLRAADDGEPNGTAGKPILLVLTSARLTEVLLIVTRFFGGTKLGTGGLARAYAEAAQQAVSMSKIRTVYLEDTITLQLGYEDHAHAERLVHTMGGHVLQSDYLTSVTMRVAIRRSLTETLIARVTDELRGRVGIVRM